ncbi:MAG: exo-alpha-sialidase [Clostridia bacterium]|nr:exo-alpha-sialidase [Clostridia bacterium]
MAIEKFIVSRDDSIYEAWPDAVLTDGGKLICVFSECEHHLDRTNARIMICESTDRGRTWSEKKPLTEKGVKENYFNCARISKLRDGHLAIVCDKILKNESSGAEQYLWFSDGEGTCWSDPVCLPFCGIVPDKLQQLRNGRILLAAHFKSPETDRLEQYLWYSDDNGSSWSERITVASDPKYNLCEVSILECGGGMLVAFLRENSRDGHDILKTISYDNGETWSDLYFTPMDCGHRPVSGFLQDGRVMVTYRYIPSATQNTFAAFFDPESLTETDRKAQRGRIMPLDYDRNSSPDLGYTGWVQFEDGELYVVNYIKDDADKAYICGYAFRPEDVMLPERKTATKNVF